LLKNSVSKLEKKVERVKFEKSCLESENYELRDNMEIIRIKAAQNNLEGFILNNDFGDIG
jgi:hypothetical protein